MTTVSPTSDLRITAAGIAELARVKRPVVTMWRRRFSDGESAFPTPCSSAGSAPLFDALEVARWLATTAHGNNPSAVEDAARFALRAGGQDHQAMSAMLALRAIQGQALADLDAEELTDLADEADPDDLALFREIERLGEEGPLVARRVDALVEAAYTPTAAMEELVASLRSTSRAGDLLLSPEASALISEIAIELALTNGHADVSQPVFVDPTGVGVDRISDIVARLDDVAEITVVQADSDSESARLLRRRLLTIGVARSGLSVESGGEFEVTVPAVHVAQYPAADGGAAAPAEILAAIDQIVLQMSDAQRGVVLAPAKVLVDGGLDVEAESLRSTLLRSGRVRAVVLLPGGTEVGSPRSRFGLWVLGPAHQTVAIADRWTLVADLSGSGLSPAIRADLIGDIATSLGDRGEVHAHPFGVGRRVVTSRLIARSGSLVDDSVAVMHATVERGAHNAADVPAQFDAVIDRLGSSAPASVAHVTASAQPRHLRSSRLGELAADGHVRCASGARIDVEDLDAVDGFTVLGVDEVIGARAVGSRRIDRMLFAGRYPRVRLTEPGDVVFTVRPTPRAVVDENGASVVVYPARILRIKRSDPAGLVPDVLAADVVAQGAHSRDWRRWSARRIVGAESDALVRVLRDVRAARADAQRRIDDLARLEQIITAGVTSGALTTLTSTTPEGND